MCVITTHRFSCPDEGCPNEWMEDMDVNLCQTARLLARTERRRIRQLMAAQQRRGRVFIDETFELVSALMEMGHPVHTVFVEMEGVQCARCRGSRRRRRGA
ncbi:hypothetical protein HIM_07135 [Hirsutella minnesotensis 3608]|uniref:Uncharacterized protein n=1 Tax=Hirsutella minnesotensis 3608 TaxID=1043627 RepID=A0A0F8A4H3_9HYPO|nr:hypothetical protein HIM_07135 [Hirsutella minnesotensis 3608]